MGVLANRHIATSGQCPLCQIYVEDVAHALFLCSRVQEVWWSLGIYDIIFRACTPQRSGAEILESLLCESTNQVQYMSEVQVSEIIAAVSWYMWWQRRQITKNEEVQTAEFTGPAIQAMTLNFVRANRKASYTCSAGEQMEKTFTRPADFEC